MLTKCPACGSELTDHQDADDDNNYEVWNFSCGAEVLNEDGTLSAESPCEHALANALEKINYAKATV